jgi:hypothetical protein
MIPILANVGFVRESQWPERAAVSFSINNSGQTVPK